MATVHRTHLNVFDPEETKADLAIRLLGLQAALSQNNLHQVVVDDTFSRLVDDEETPLSTLDYGRASLPGVAGQQKIFGGRNHCGRAVSSGAESGRIGVR